MELLITIAYIFLVRLIFFDYKLLRFNLFWKFFVFGLYFAAALTEVTLLGQFTPYSKEAFVQAYVVRSGSFDGCQWVGFFRCLNASAGFYRAARVR